MTEYDKCPRCGFADIARDYTGMPMCLEIDGGCGWDGSMEADEVPRPTTSKAELAARDAIWAALEYSADTSKGDWRVSYHEAAQRMRQILEAGLNE